MSHPCRLQLVLCVFISGWFTASLDAGITLPEPPPPEGPTLAEFVRTSNPEGTPSWRVMHAGTAAASTVRSGNRDVLRLPCNFAGTTFERASWDRKMTLDLTAAHGVQFQFFCPDITPVSQFAMYFHSGTGWYGIEFNPEQAGGWTTIQIEKDRTWVEGRPAGWDQISEVRVSAWRGGNTDTEFYIADFALTGTDAPIVMLSPAGASPPARAAGDRVRALRRLLDDLELPYLVMPDQAVKPEHLRDRRLVIVAGSGPPAALKPYAAAGGAVLSLEKTDTTEQAAVLESMPDAVGLVEVLQGLAPEVARLAASTSLQRIGAIGPYRSLKEAVDGLAALRPGPGVLDSLERVGKLEKEARRLLHDGASSKAVEVARRARAEMLQAYCAAQRPAPGEFRAFWCHDAFGVKGMTWDQAIRTLADNGFTAILPNMLWGGIAYYASDVLPVAPEVAEKGDQIAECLAACRKYGVQCHVWKVNWNMSHRTPKEFLERMRSEGRTQVRFSGERQDLWLCPSHPANRKLEIDAMVEVATKYELDGVHFDYIRYPDADGCFCAGCRERFEHAIGAAVAKWPGDVRADRDLLEKWRAFRRENITAVVAAVAERVHRERPGVKVSAAVFRHWPADRDAIGQDWKLWCDRAYLDFICPMNYTPSSHKFESVIRSQLEWTGKVPCYPGIGLSVWPDRTDVVKLIEQIEITRRLGTGGFTVFNYANVEAAQVVPLCGQGITRRPQPSVAPASRVAPVSNRWLCVAPVCNR